jgi:hypothetical protein
MSWAVPLKAAPAADDRRSFLFVTDQHVLADDVADRCWLSLKLRSGGAIEFAEGPDLVEPETALARLMATLASGRYRTDQVLRQIEPLATGLRRRSLQRCPDPEVIEMGVPPRRPTASLIIDAGEDRDRLSAVLSLLAIDPQIDETELLIVVTDIMCRTGCKVSELMAGYRLPGRLVVVNDTAARSAALNCAAAASTAPLLVFLEGNAVPETTGWLGALTTLLGARAEHGLVAALPIHPDQSIAGVGVDFVDDFDDAFRPRPRLNGFPRDYHGAKTALVAATIAGCYSVQRSLFERIGGFPLEYFTADARFMDFCLQIGDTGAEVWQSDAAAVMLFDPMVPAAISGPIEDIQSALDARLLERRWRTRLADQPAMRAMVGVHSGNVSRVAAVS